MQTALKLGRISAPIIFAMQRDQRLRELLSTRLTNPQDSESTCSVLGECSKIIWVALSRE